MISIARCCRRNPTKGSQTASRSVLGGVGTVSGSGEKTIRAVAGR